MSKGYFTPEVTVSLNSPLPLCFVMPIFPLVVALDCDVEILFEQSLVVPHKLQWEKKTCIYKGISCYQMVWEQLTTFEVESEIRTGQIVVAPASNCGFLHWFHYYKYNDNRDVILMGKKLLGFALQIIFFSIFHYLHSYCLCNSECTVQIPHYVGTSACNRDCCWAMQVSQFPKGESQHINQILTPIL